jgi:hypothetical protein
MHKCVGVLPPRVVCKQVVNPDAWATVAGKNSGDEDDAAHPPSKAEQRRRTKGFAPPFPLEPELEARP